MPTIEKIKNRTNGIFRFYINKPVRELSSAVLRRLLLSDDNVRCMVFSSATAARRCLTTLRASRTHVENPTVLEVARFFMPLESFQGATACHWANFSALLFPFELLKEAMAFWRDTGSGLSTRHAEFCLGELDYLDCDSENPEFRSPAPLKRDHHGIPQTLACVQSAASSAPELRSILAKLATSDRPGEPDVLPDDVFLYPTGMNAIFSLSESLSSITPNSNVAAFGYDSPMFPPNIIY